jgi:hypothetical protein
VQSKSGQVIASATGIPTAPAPDIEAARKATLEAELKKQQQQNDDLRHLLKEAESNASHVTAPPASGGTNASAGEQSEVKTMVLALNSPARLMLRLMVLSNGTTGLSRASLPSLLQRWGWFGDVNVPFAELVTTRLVVSAPEDRVRIVADPKDLRAALNDTLRTDNNYIRRLAIGQFISRGEQLKESLLQAAPNFSSLSSATSAWANSTEMWFRTYLDESYVARLRVAHPSENPPANLSAEAGRLWTSIDQRDQNLTKMLDEFK